MPPRSSPVFILRAWRCGSIPSRWFMRSRWACLAAIFLVLEAGAQYRTALPGYRYAFPRDHFNHPDFQTEWWYYTGNVKAQDGHRFGFELTFFRRATDRTDANSNAWDVRHLSRSFGLERFGWRSILSCGTHESSRSGNRRDQGKRSAHLEWQLANRL